MQHYSDIFVILKERITTHIVLLSSTRNYTVDLKKKKNKTMACLLLNQENISIKIPSVDTIDGVTFYLIEVKVGEIIWTLKHRYNEFAELHETLVSEHCVEKEILPPKKLIGNKSEAFIEKRRLGLEIYLNSVYNYLKKTMPREFAIFLELHIYDIFFLLQNMALQFFTEGESLLQAIKKYTFTPLQVRILFICIIMKLPCTINLVQPV